MSIFTILPHSGVLRGHRVRYTESSEYSHSMSVKIINVLKDDSFNDILELFRKAAAGEVILVLPRNGKLFRHEDHFAAFAAESTQGAKTVSILTANPLTAQLARKFGFNVMSAGKSKAEKPVKATLTTQPLPADDDMQDFNDTADLGDATPLTSDETMGSSKEEDEDLLPTMHIEDAEGNHVDEDADGAPDRPLAADLHATNDELVRSLSAEENAIQAQLAAAVDGVRGGLPHRIMNPSGRAERSEKVAIENARELDYIDAMWRDKVGFGPNTHGRMAPHTPSLWSRLFTRTASVGSSHMSKGVAASILLGSCVVLAAVVYMVTGSAHVSIIPVGSPIDTTLSVQTSDTFASIDEAFLKLPGQLLEVTKTNSHTVQATGTRDVASKARGKITIYNEYSSSPQSLVATTRFESSDGKVFRTLQTVTVPGSTVKAGTPTPGSMSVDVIADKPGTDYNVPAGSFTIVAFRESGDTEKAAKFYGRSEQPMTGGASGPSSVVTQADFDAAKQAAIEGVKEQIKTALGAQGSELTIVNQDTPEFKDIQATAQPDDAAGAVTVTATGTLSTVAFRRSDLDTLIAKSFLNSARLFVQPDFVILSYSDVTLKRELDTLAFTVRIKGTAFKPIDIELVKKSIAGKEGERVREFFRNKEEFRSATISLSPFWVRSVPSELSKILVDIQYDAAVPESY